MGRVAGGAESNIRAILRISLDAPNDVGKEFYLWGQDSGDDSPAVRVGSDGRVLLSMLVEFSIREGRLSGPHAAEREDAWTLQIAHKVRFRDPRMDVRLPDRRRFESGDHLGLAVHTLTVTWQAQQENQPEWKLIEDLQPLSEGFFSEGGGECAMRWSGGSKEGLNSL